MQRTKYNLTAGIYTPIPALQFARRVELAEDGSGSASGIIVKFPDDSYTAAMEYLPAQQPCVLGNVTAQGGGQGPLLGHPAQSGINQANATVYAMVTAVAGTTVLRVTEID